MIKPLGICETFDKLRSEILSLIASFGAGRTQLICQTIEKDSIDWFTGVGSIYDLEHKDEHLYVNLNLNLIGTNVESLINRFNGFRSRIMIMPPKTCYSVHADPTPRIHIPIVTNTQAWMVWPMHAECYYLQERLIYWTDTTKNHTFFNGGLEDRIHLVMCVKE